MSEKIQRTSETVREQMLVRYGNELHHKHNKNHRPYRMHSPSHPVLKPNFIHEIDLDQNVSTNVLREFKLRKIRKRSDNRIH